MAKAEIPIYRYTLTIQDSEGREQPSRTVDAMQYQLDGDWFVFDDATTTVLTIRRNLVTAVERGAQVNTEEVDAL